MPDTKITALAAITTVDPAADVLPIVDISDTSMAASGTTKKITSNQILGAGGTATLASATITGDLTVDTSTLKVDSTNNRVGIGTATPAFELDVTGSTRSTGDITTQAGKFVTGVSGQTVGMLLAGFVPGASYDNYILNNSGNASTTATLHFGRLTSLLYGFIRTNNNSQNLQLGTTGAGSVEFFQNNSTAMTLNSTGLGVGVTPYASWPATSKALQLGASSAIEGRTNDGSRSAVYTNAVWNGTNLIYQNTAAASYYLQSSGIHSWHNAASGTAGNAITFTQAMTLDAGGNLLVGKTVNNITTVGFQSTSTGEVSAALAASTNAATQWTTYSTGAAAYRFYVGMAGTVFATNTTISAISDARLKENVQDLDVGLGAILALKPRKFDWKEGKGKNIKGDRGFIAQEFETVFPNLIDEWKDNAPEGEAPYKSVRQDLIPVLVKAIQELAAEVNALKNA